MSVSLRSTFEPPERPSFDLVQELMDRRANGRKGDKDSPWNIEATEERYPDSIKTTKLTWPVWIKRDIDRLLCSAFERVTEQDAINVLIDRGLARLQGHYPSTGQSTPPDIPQYILWRRLKHAAIQGSYPDKTDYDEVFNFAESFPFDIATRSTPVKPRNVRILDSILKDLSIASITLGVSQSTLAQVFIVDGLRGQPDLMHLELMDATVEEFYRKLWKRVRQLAANLLAFQVELSQDGKEALAEVNL
ncbi:MAG TPA: hypothetical protein VHK68_12710 [Gemmatimonadales bacterium]|nr:hypothetical protein [Gemmatimonadales bacterium]